MVPSSFISLIKGRFHQLSNAQIEMNGIVHCFSFVECDLVVDRGTCTGQFNRYYYDPAVGACKLFSYTGCGGNLNNFKSLSECNQRCICTRPVDAGPCNQGTLRYFYNKATSLCQLFVFGGCNGNNNNFPTEGACSDVCRITDVPQRCTKRPEYGTCTNTTLRYFYDKNCDCCQTFQYSGCEGNHNNFETEEHCLSKCTNFDVSTTSPTTSTTQPTTTSVIPARCLERKDKGPCNAKIVRYFYNKRTNTCEFFLWGGCGGTSNNFRSRRFCAQTCRI